MTRNLWLVPMLLAGSAGTAHAQEPLPWLSAEGKTNVEVHAAGTLAAGPVVQITGGALKTSTTVLELAPVKVPSHRYVLSGRVKYANVDGVGYLEMLSTFSGQRTYFTKTLGDSGTMASLSGTSDWRDVELPFLSDPGMVPEKIVVNVVLPGKGTVYLAPLTMSAFTGALSATGGWWDERRAGLLGGGLGTAIGIAGSLVGLGAGFGFGRRWVMALCWVQIVFGLCCLVVGLVAVAIGQPFWVYYPLLLIGIIAPAVFGFNLPAIRRRYDEREMRKMAAQDA